MSTRSALRLFVLLVVLAPAAGNAQGWRKISAPRSYTGSLLCPYFINTDTGFLYDNEFGTEPDNLAYFYRTSNAGADWSPVDAFDQMTYTIRQVCFATRDRGYAIVDTAYGKGLVMERGLLFESTNAGLDWKQISPTWMNAKSVYATGNTIFVTATAHGFVQYFGSHEGTFPYPDSAAIYRSRDFGHTWDSIPAGPTLPKGSYLLLSELAGNRDSLVCVLASDPTTQTYFIHSEDLGNSWHTEMLEKLNIPRSYELQAYCFPYSCRVIRLLNDARLQALDSFAFYEAMPPYTAASWHQKLSAETGGWVAGTNCVQYLGNASYTRIPGLLRWRTGDTLKSVGGPDLTEVDDEDFRTISVVGHGAVVYATGSQSNGGLWRTIDGGDSSLSVSELSPTLSVDRKTIQRNGDVGNTNTIDASDTVTIIFTDRNTGCSLTRLDSVYLTGIPAAEYSIVTLRHTPCTGIGDTTFIGIRANGSYSGPFGIHAHFADDEFNGIDTTLSMTITRPLNGVSTLSHLLQTRAVSIEAINPNPATGTVHVVLYSASNNPLCYQLIDALGTVRRSGTFIGGADEANLLDLDVEGLPAGAYSLQVASGSGAHDARMVMIGH